MLRRSFYLLLMLVAIALVVAACNSDDDGDDDVEPTPTTEQVESTPTPESDDPATDETDDATDENDDNQQETPEIEGRRGLIPYEVSLVGESEEQAGKIGPHFWTDDEAGLAGEAAGGFYERHDEPMQVESGESLAIEVDDDDFPNEIQVEIYEAVDPEEDDEVDNLVSMPDEPLDTIELDVDDGTWTVDLDPGEYYVSLQTIWPTSDMWDRPREASYRFWIEVS